MTDRIRDSVSLVFMMLFGAYTFVVGYIPCFIMYDPGLANFALMLTVIIFALCLTYIHVFVRERFLQYAEGSDMRYRPFLVSMLLTMFSLAWLPLFGLFFALLLLFTALLSVVLLIVITPLLLLDVIDRENILPTSQTARESAPRFVAALDAYIRLIRRIQLRFEIFYDSAGMVLGSLLWITSALWSVSLCNYEAPAFVLALLLGYACLVAFRIWASFLMAKDKSVRRVLGVGFEVVLAPLITVFVSIVYPPLFLLIWPRLRRLGQASA